MPIMLWLMKGWEESFSLAVIMPPPRTIFVQALKYNPKLWEAHNFLGIIFDKEDQYDEAMNHFLAAIQYKTGCKRLI